jgi:hypothetical protein
MFMSFLSRFSREDGGYGEDEQGRDVHGMAAAAAWMRWLNGLILQIGGGAAGPRLGADRLQSIHLRLH